MLERQGIRLSSAYSVVERRIIHRSDIMLTPYTSPRRIDTTALSAFIAAAYSAAGWTPAMVDTGAVITTGEAARKENAAAIVALFSGEAGRFVCATAGHHLESLLAAHGSGAAALSREPATPVVLNVDIGGGTTKLAVCCAGVVVETAAIDLGARVVSWDETGEVLEVTGAGLRIAADVGVRLSPGDRPGRATLEALADRIAELALRIPAGLPLGDERLWLTAPLMTSGRFSALVFSGGVGEYLNGGEAREYGDLGALLALAIARRIDGYTVLRPVESIRATCIGAAQYTIQVSGDTLFLSDPALLPLRDLAAVAIRPPEASAAEIGRSVRSGIARLDREDGAFALAIRWDHGPTYPALRELAEGIRDGVADVLPALHPLVVVLDADVAGIVGQILQGELGIRGPIICVDQITLSDLDFIDIGELVPEQAVVPVIVKSLVFAER
ncbi:MAG: ethanolamine ammonia-lyase reactivating factor EutA [Chloroflexota bacterium]|nr:ethanolamine ammonia-lyase reactivating factor EutA [Chloroflexota bacterium]